MNNNPNLNDSSNSLPGSLTQNQSPWSSLALPFPTTGCQTGTLINRSNLKFSEMEPSSLYE